MMDSFVQWQTMPFAQRDEHLQVFEWLLLPRQALPGHLG
jgi:hypothetical protein